MAGVMAGFIASACWAASPPPDLGHVAPTVDAVAEAARQVRAAGCVSPDCRAMVSIADVLRIDLAASAATVARPRPIPGDRDAAAARSLGAALLDHPERFDAVCDGAARLLSRYSLPGSAAEVFVPVHLILLGLDMDQRSGGGCMPRLLAALPDTDAARTAVEHARRLCTGRRTVASCGRIDRP